MGPTASISLPAVLDLAAVGPLRGAFLARVGSAVEVDGSEVRRLGGQCLQVLMAAQHRWAADGLAFEVLSPSPEFVEGLELFGAPRLTHAADPLAFELLPRLNADVHAELMA